MFLIVFSFLPRATTLDCAWSGEPRLRRCTFSQQTFPLRANVEEFVARKGVSAKVSVFVSTDDTGDETRSESIRISVGDAHDQLTIDDRNSWSHEERQIVVDKINLFMDYPLTPELHVSYNSRLYSLFFR